MHHLQIRQAGDGAFGCRLSLVIAVETDADLMRNAPIGVVFLIPILLFLKLKDRKTTVRSLHLRELATYGLVGTVLL